MLTGRMPTARPRPRQDRGVQAVRFSGPRSPHLCRRDRPETCCRGRNVHENDIRLSSFKVPPRTYLMSMAPCFMMPNARLLIRWCVSGERLACKEMMSERATVCSEKRVKGEPPWRPLLPLSYEARRAERTPPRVRWPRCTQRSEKTEADLMMRAMLWMMVQPNIQPTRGAGPHLARANHSDSSRFDVMTCEPAEIKVQLARAVGRLWQESRGGTRRGIHTHPQLSPSLALRRLRLSASMSVTACSATEAGEYAGTRTTLSPSRAAARAREAVEDSRRAMNAAASASSGQWGESHLHRRRSC